MKIVFIINSISAQRCIKRVEEFISNGYEVDVYGFSRKMGALSVSSKFEIKVIGEFSNKESFYNRLKAERRAINKVVKKYKKQNVVFYLFQLDVAIAFAFCTTTKKYIYEESDLVHADLRNSLLRKTLGLVDKCIIKRSICTISTSEGFLKYHFGNNIPDNIYLIPNRLNTKILELENVKKVERSKTIRIGFVGFVSFDAILSFVKIFCENFPDNEFHFYGKPMEVFEESYNELKKYSNCYLHGSFSNPADLPTIYSTFDVVLSAYDTSMVNVRYAEPNKLYEAIYFETPIIVSDGTFVAEKVKRLGIGYCLPSIDEVSVKTLVESITNDSLNERIKACKIIDKKECLSINDSVYRKIKQRLDSLN